MIRTVGAVGVALLLLVSFALYNGVYRVKAQERELKEMDMAIAREAEAIRVLKAEWSYLNQPERLQALARRHLTLSPTGAAQIVVMANLPERGSAAANPVNSVEAAELPFRDVPTVVPRDSKAQLGGVAP
jgi:hypothetical protein